MKYIHSITHRSNTDRMQNNEDKNKDTKAADNHRRRSANEWREEGVNE